MDICRDNYIVRVYRRNKDNLYNIVGIVEDVEHETNKAFHNAEELAVIIAGEGKKDVKEMQRNNRLRLMLPVKVRGVNIIGKRFKEDAFIKDISSGGAYLYMKNQVSADARLRIMIDPARSSLNIKARVVRIVKEGNGNGVGVSFQ
ncbi:MAG: PilZ domain-containing protein [Deltaproteobacteria bacterium]|nr:PilZ domain-containing protein [Deltaproteobacteria bacterium]